ncbi:MAG: DUF4202 domain-containing protein [Deltaproteobacteria bacterium]|nr:DUF4202 domain-containing protein [Deltaproteobacteria bacterium]
MRSIEGCVALRVRDHRAAAPTPPSFAQVAREFPFVAIEQLSADVAGDNAIRVSISEWRDSAFDWWTFDRAIDGATDGATEAKGLTILLTGAAAELPAVSLELLLRCQRAIARRNQQSCSTLFDAVLECHRAIHDVSLPLVQADLAHALDVWQWLLRLAPDASLAVQLAALFHDIERLVTESERRIEQHASDYQTFKDSHAARGAELAAALLRELELADDVVDRAAWLIATHERRSDEPELALLNDADALSFFSLNSPGFADYYGPEHTRMKVAYTLNRLRPPSRRFLDHIRLRPEVRALVDESLGARSCRGNPR